MERDGKKRGKQLVNVADHCVFLKALSPCCLSIVLQGYVFFGADPRAFLKLEQRNYAACRIYRN